MSTKTTRRNRIPASDRGKTRRDHTRSVGRRQLDFYFGATGGEVQKHTTPSRSRLLPGTVVWSRIEFDDGADSKIRPSVVVSHQDRYQIIVAPLSTKANGRTIDTSACGLPSECGLKGDIRTIARTDVLSIAGTMAAGDFELVLAVVHKNPTYARAA